MNNYEAVKRMAEKYKPVSQKVIRHLVRKGFLTETLDRERDIDILEFLCRTWADPTILRPQLAMFSKKRRLDLIETAELNKWETYVFSRFKNASGRLTVTMVSGEVEVLFGVTVDGFIERRIRELRKMVQNARYYAKKKNSGTSSHKEVSQ